MGKSPFVIFRPQGGASRTTTDSHVPIRATDLPAIDSSFPNGGSVLSVHAPLQADAWLDAHCGDSVVRALNASGLRGPLPAMLDPTLSALVLFGATGDRAHHKHAKRLADISGLTVLLRALEDFPVFGADLDLESSDDVSASGGETAKETTAEQRQGVSFVCGAELAPTMDRYGRVPFIGVLSRQIFSSSYATKIQSFPSL